ncbi:L-serine ammonia-lyase, iron-sulfur-dependent, subunit alpha [Anaerosacchariphilus polymeriproducens]|uniref:L-serine dehydratase n=1 Tax=Anaerosacchariphilus polymeriproducens TaxID=1812858 RepID=A0A371AZ83_9FIRM|nr:L-serine ammonia-lyase, iron-sulfur-dependent, subunit alpha [Anaerosacchariphilus polymeriproducens]RDU24812.1 L-serine ammonia-lyase, iron-sulfur-dependent, subunit alpha [Anaerosacchariphilus polymeriproducens]
MSYHSLEEIIEKAQREKKKFWEIILEDDMNERQVTKEKSMNKMKKMLVAMREAHENYDKDLISSSKLVGGDGHRVKEAREKGMLICGDFIGAVMEKAIKMGESNACMRRVVAAPTAGSCGVIPAVLLSYDEFYLVEEEKLIEALYVTAGIGQVIAKRAFIAGAMGGCQAEIGSASAMVAGAVVYLRDGSLEQIANASAIALKNLLGLVCDPIGGLVEVPCVKRNVIGAVNALTSADLSLAGVVSKVPADQVIDAMGDIGSRMPASLKETSEGGLAITPTGLEVAKRLEEA